MGLQLSRKVNFFGKTMPVYYTAQKIVTFLNILATIRSEYKKLVVFKYPSDKGAGIKKR